MAIRAPGAGLPGHPPRGQPGSWPPFPAQRPASAEPRPAPWSSLPQDRPGSGCRPTPRIKCWCARCASADRLQA